ncbi:MULTISPECIES: hypothetical protein [unclassified Frankia]|uniref:hypothetical protein n=1 Tax=unclassified Frankia TaxID=2632575 RepID=UPI002AD23268|nr:MULTISPECIES: hypothetical protein [unclassified Frankia]
MDVATVAVWATLAGPACALVGVCLRLRARARRDHEDRELVLKLAGQLPRGGRLVYQRDEECARTMVATSDQDA